MSSIEESTSNEKIEFKKKKRNKPLRQRRESSDEEDNEIEPNTR